MTQTLSDQPRLLTYKLPKPKKGTAPRSVAVVIGGTRFRCRPSMDGISFLEFAGALSALNIDEDDDDADTGKSIAAAGQLLEILRTAIIDYDKFREFVKEHGLDVEFITTIATDLIEQYTDTPTEEPSES